MVETPTFPHDEIEELVLAAHRDLETVEEIIEENPSYVNIPHEWGDGDTESAIQAAAHVGRRDIAEYLLENAGEYEIEVAAMMGDEAEVEAQLDALPELADRRAAHDIHVLAHAAIHGEVGVAELLYAHGAEEGYDEALITAARHGQQEFAEWLVEHGASPDATDDEDTPAAAVAREAGHEDVAELLEERAAA